MGDQPGSLRELVDLAMRHRGTSNLSELKRMARLAGHQISDSTLGQMAKGEYSGRPSRRTLSALAFLAGVSYEVAEAAAGMATNPLRPFADQMPAEVNSLSPRRRVLAVAVLRELISAQRLEDQLGEPADDDVEFMTDEGLGAAPDLLPGNHHKGETSTE